MSLKLITFSIFKEENRDACCQFIKSHDHIEVSGSGFIIDTSQSVDLLRRELSDYFDKTDELFITKIRKGEYLSFHLGSKRKWIEERL